MERTFFDLNLLANIVAKLGNIVGEHVKFDFYLHAYILFHLHLELKSVIGIIVWCTCIRL